MDRVAQQVKAGSASHVVPLAGLALGLSIPPETVSHLSDGSRFDYRPAFDAIRRLGPEHLVLGRTDTIRQAEAPDLKYERLWQTRQVELPPGYWLITSRRRFGLREGGRELQAWMDLKCRRVSSFERPRLDYRLYRVEPRWCGTQPLPSLSR